MAGELDVIRLKVTRAEKHFEEFKAAVGLGPDERKLDLASVTVNSADNTLLYHNHKPTPPPETRIILGDSIHQLRAALDHLVCVLAMRTNARNVCEDSKLQFPIVKTEPDFRSDWRVSKGVYEQLLGKAELKEIERCQPYALAPQKPEGHPLYVLTKLDNIDKHRLVLVVEQAVRLSGAYVRPGDEILPYDSGKQTLTGGKYLVQLTPPERPYGLQLHPAVAYIVFAETDGLCDGRSIFPLFREMAAAVKDTIARFDQFF